MRKDSTLTNLHNKAAHEGQFDIKKIKQAQSKGVDVSEFDTDKEGFSFSLLILAAQSGREDVVRHLLQDEKVKPTINFPKKGLAAGRTALYQAAANNHPECAAILIEHRARPDLLHEGNTPLMIAATNGHAETVHYLAHLEKFSLEAQKGADALRLALSKVKEQKPEDPHQLCATILKNAGVQPAKETPKEPKPPSLLFSLDFKTIRITEKAQDEQKEMEDLPPTPIPNV